MFVGLVPRVPVGPGGPARGAAGLVGSRLLGGRRVALSLRRASSVRARLRLKKHAVGKSFQPARLRQEPEEATNESPVVAVSR